MSKHKNKKNKAATPKEPITRRDLCERICVLQQEINRLRQINTSFAHSAISNKDKSLAALNLAEDRANDLKQMAKLALHYKIMTSIAIIALILSGILHLINIFF